MAVNAKGTLLAAADDSGQTAVIDIAAGTLVRTLKKGHQNIASSVSFREHNPWEVVTGGLDSCIIRWDFSSGRPLRRWTLGERNSSQLDRQQTSSEMCMQQMSRLASQYIGMNGLNILPGSPVLESSSTFHITCRIGKCRSSGEGRCRLKHPPNLQPTPGAQHRNPSECRADLRQSLCRCLWRWQRGSL